jgi:hypothetical protein
VWSHVEAEIFVPRLCPKGIQKDFSILYISYALKTKLGIFRISPQSSSIQPIRGRLVEVDDHGEFLHALLELAPLKRPESLYIPFCQTVTQRLSDGKTFFWFKTATHVYPLVMTNIAMA